MKTYRKRTAKEHIEWSLMFMGMVWRCNMPLTSKLYRTIREVYRFAHRLIFPVYTSF